MKPITNDMISMKPSTPISTLRKLPIAAITDGRLVGQTIEREGYRNRRTEDKNDGKIQLAYWLKGDWVVATQIYCLFSTRKLGKMNPF